MPDFQSGDGVIQVPVKSPNDNKEYRIIQLDNGLRAVIISDLSSTPEGENDTGHLQSEGGDDEETGELIEDEENELQSSGDSKRNEKLAAAGLCINAGSFFDPDDIPGLAHFLEHMVFLGSEKYPAENSFTAFIKRHGGSFNADTDCEKTVFHFDIHTKHFRQALDHLAQFFVCPMLNPESMEREMEAVDSEFQMDSTSDDSRKQQLIKNLAKDDQPSKKFIAGNLETLRTKPSELNIDLHSRVKEFFQRYYSAQYITLAVQSRETLDTLESWIREMFSEIPNNNLLAPNFDHCTDPFDTPEFYKLYKIIPVKSGHQLQLTWALLSLTKYYRVKPERYLSMLIEHEGEGSILSYLKKKNWALSLNCQEDGSENNVMYTLLRVVVELTEDGLTNIFEVITVIFEYLEMLRRLGPQEKIYQEIQMIKQNDFRWQDELPSDYYVQNMCVNLQRYSEEDLITGGHLLFDYDENVIADIQNILLPEKCNIMIMSHTFEKEESTKIYEKWFQTPYFVEDVDSEWLEKWKQLDFNPHFHLPDANKFIASNFDIKNPDFPSTEYPVKILDNDQCRLWYKKDDKFRAPKAHVFFNLISPIVNNSPLNAVLLDIFDDILKQNLAEAVYPADVAQLSHIIYGDNSGLVIHIEGFNDKIPILFETILDYIYSFSVKDELFEAVKKGKIEDYYNKFIDPHYLCTEIQSSILQHIYWTSLDKRAVVEDVTSEMLLNFINNLKSKLFVESLVQGNMTGKEAIEMVEMIQSKFKCTEIPKNQIPEVQVMQLNESEKYCRIGSFNTTDKNSVIDNIYQFGPGNIHKKCLMELLINLMEEPCFNTLRTQQQLGYAISCRLQKLYGILGFGVKVQTQADKFSCSQVDERIEAFLRDFLTKLETEVTEKEFQSQVTALIRSKRCVDLRLMDEVCRNWIEITSGTYLFNRNNLEIEHLNKITLTEFRENFQYEELFGVGKKLRKLGIQIVGAGQIQESKNQQSQKSTDLEIPGQSDDEEYKLQFDPLVEDDSRFIKDIHIYKQGLMIFPVTKIVE